MDGFLNFPGVDSEGSTEPGYLSLLANVGY